MPSSISSSDAPDAAWGRILGLALLLALGLAAATEIGLRVKGIRPTVPDSAALWSRQRERAWHPRALVLIGASRMQLDVDLDVLRERTGLEPIQLAIDGTSFVPVLLDLGADNAFRGTVLVDFTDQSAFDPGTDADALAWLKAHRDSAFAVAPSAWIEGRLAAFARRRLAAFADGATPISSWTQRILGRGGERQYLETRPDRSRLADYRQVQMPEFRYERALRHIRRGDLATPGITAAHLDAAIADAIATTMPAQPGAGEEARLAAIGQAVERIQARGGRVVFVRLPTDGFVRDYDRVRWPEAQFEMRFRERVAAPWIDSADHPSLAIFATPDGSHLDRRDRPAFSAALAEVLIGEARPKP